MTQIFKTLLTIAVVVGVAIAAPRPEKSELSNEIAPPVLTKNGDSVSASWGGFHAAASLADDGSGAVASAGGNGLGASSGYGPAGAGAGAGVGFVGASEFASTGVHNMKPAAGGYGNGGKPEGPNYHGGVGTGVGGNGGGFFDKIFAIPINVLQSVNTYLNQKQIHQGQPGAIQGQHHNGVAASASAVSGSDKVPAAAVSADYGHDSAGISANGKTGTPMMVQKNANFDEIFNIPITALRSVQNLLNG